MQRLYRPLQLIFVYGLALVACWLAQRFSVPVPWMIGPLLLSGAIALIGWDARVPPATRLAGQVIVAGAIGLTLTATTLGAVLLSAGWIIVIAFGTIIIAAGVAWVVSRLSNVDLGMLCLVCIPAGPIETANIAYRYNVPSAPIIFGQTLRVAIIVLFLPPIVVWLKEADAGAITQIAPTLPYWIVALLFAWCTLVSLAFHRTRVPNAFFLGAMVAASLVGISGLVYGRVPSIVLSGGQVLLGVWLGGVFNRHQIKRAGGQLMVVVAATIAVLALCGFLGLAVAWASGLSWETMVLAAAPGSVTEMALTAELIQASPVTVTAFHVIRIFLVVPAAGVIFSVARRVGGGKGDADAAMPPGE
jgi:membrane AbrB-like protein